MKSIIELMTKQGEELLEKHSTTPHLEVAMNTQNPALATAVKYLQKAATKLPLWCKKKCLIDNELYEQCTSQIAAISKFSETPKGKLAIDLTCGLGVDSWALSKRFKRVISVEINPKKAEIAKYNFQKLGVKNIVVENICAQEFCEKMAAENITADLIYIDPSRITGSGKKVYSLEHSSPNIIELLPTLKNLTQRIIIKLSPLFDIKECYEVFGRESMVSIISSDGECRELLVELSNDADNHTQNPVNHIVIQGEKTTKIAVIPQEKTTPTTPILNPKFIYTPNVAFYKSRTVKEYIQKENPKINFHFDSYIFTETPLSKTTIAQRYTIDETHPYSPKTLAKLLKTKGIKKATIHLKNFPQTLQQIQKNLKITQGNQQSLIFTTYNEKPTVFFVSLGGSFTEK